MKRAAVGVVFVAAVIAAWMMLRTRRGAEVPSVRTVASASSPTPTPTKTPTVGVRLVRARVTAEVATGATTFGGRVVSTADGRGVRASLTFLHEGAAIGVECDDEGSFRLVATTPGSYELTAAEARGFEPFAPLLGHSPLVWMARAGVRVDDVTIYLTPASATPADAGARPTATARLAIGGRVVDRAGRPVDGARVEASGAGFAQTLSGVDGKFALAALDDGEYTLRAFARGQGSAQRAGVRAGARDVELRLGAPGAGLRGHVRDAGGKPIAAFTVVAWPRRGALGRGPEERASVIDADGAYELPLPPGAWVVAAAARGHAKSDEQSVEIADDAVERDFVLRGGSKIAGRVVERGGGGAIAGARIAVEGDTLGDDVTLSTDAVSAADGSFTVDGLAPGRHSIDVGADGHDSRIVSGLQVPPDGTLGPLTIDLARVAPGEQPKRELVGIGVEIGVDDNGNAILIRRAVAGGGAADAGLVSGDVILAVDGTSVEQLSFPTAVQNIRGDEGTIVTLTVRRKDGSIQLIRVVRKRLSA